MLVKTTYNNGTVRTNYTRTAESDTRFNDMRVSAKTGRTWTSSDGKVQVWLSGSFSNAFTMVKVLVVDYSTTMVAGGRMTKEQIMEALLKFCKTTLRDRDVHSLGMTCIFSEGAPGGVSSHRRPEFEHSDIPMPRQVNVIHERIYERRPAQSGSEAGAMLVGMALGALLSRK